MEREYRKTMKNAARIILLFLIIAAMIPLLLPYDAARSIGDALSVDGKVERLTPVFYRGIQAAGGAAGFFFFGLFLWLHIDKNSFRRFGLSVSRLPKRLIHDIPSFFKLFGNSLRCPRSETALILLILISGIIVRFLQADRPLYHDEAYTIYTWGMSDFSFAVSDYHLPNNHLFNTVLINWIYHLFGVTPLLMRLPALIFGILIIPSAWLLGKKFYNKQAGLIAAAVTAFAPYLIDYSVNSRGYSIQASLSMMTILLSVCLRRHKNIFGWFLLILLSALNFFTLPMALYPFAAICLWLLCCVIWGDFNETEYNGKWNLFKYLIGCGLCVTALTGLFYLPLLAHAGFSAFFGNIYVSPLPAGDFIPTSLSRMIDTFIAFTDTMPAGIWILIFAGNLFSLIFHRRGCKTRISFQVILLEWMLIESCIQRPNLWPRTLLFLHPLIIVWGAGGLTALADWFLEKVRFNRFTRFACLIPLTFLVISGIPQMKKAIQTTSIIGPDERAVQLLIENEGENSQNVLFVTSAQDNAPIWVYAAEYGLPKKIFDKQQSFNTIYVFVNPVNDAYLGPKTLDEQLAVMGPGDVFIRRETAQILMNEPNAILYRFDANLSAVDKAYEKKAP